MSTVTIKNAGLDWMQQSQVQGIVEFETGGNVVFNDDATEKLSILCNCTIRRLSNAWVLRIVQNAKNGLYTKKAV